MDLIESLNLVLRRIEKLDPENAWKIIGYLLLCCNGEQDIINLAKGPEAAIQELVQEAISKLKQPLQQSGFRIAVPANRVNPLNFSSDYGPLPAGVLPRSLINWEPQPAGTNPGPVSPEAALPLQNLFNWETPLAGISRSPGFRPASEFSHNVQVPILEEQLEHVNFVNIGFSGDLSHPDAAFGSLGPRTRTRTNFPLKVCHYFNKGFCKHGVNCRFFHGKIFGDLCQPEDYVLWPASLENLELEIVELLKSRRGNPVSIASLPMLYFEKYGKVLRADGYLTESQRHGKAGYSLTRLLARLKNNIRLIDRPHGQHAVVLAEDAPKYMDNVLSPSPSGSRQIYLTFPADSNFTEEDVSNYFSTFGQVEDVRIPCQQKRMFGFVTFASPDTVKTILANGNPHYVCGARVLVKPYREKSRKYQDRIEPFYHPYEDAFSELHLLPGERGAPRLLRRRLIEAENLVDAEGKRLAELQLRGKPRLLPSHLSCSYGSQGAEDDLKFPLAEHFNDLLKIFDEDDNVRPTRTANNDQESEGINLPENPFSSSLVE